jgi:hypothetical protein
MELSDELIEALDAVVYTWSKPRAGDSQLNAHQAGVHLLDVLAEDYDYIGTADEVIPDLVDELMSRETEVGGEWHARAAPWSV